MQMEDFNGCSDDRGLWNKLWPRKEVRDAGALKGNGSCCRGENSFNCLLNIFLSTNTTQRAVWNAG